MSLFSVFTDAFKKAANSRADAAQKAIDSGAGGTLGSTPQPVGGSFNPLRPAPGSPSSSPLDHFKAEGIEPPDAGGDVTEMRRPPSDFKIEGLKVAGDPDAGGGVTEMRRPPTDLKIEGLNVAGDPAAGGQVSEAKGNLDSAFTRRLRESPDFKAEGATDLKSSDPEEGGEFHRGDVLRAAEPGGARPLGSEHKIEGAPDLKSSDPQEGGELHRPDVLHATAPGVGRPVGSEHKIEGAPDLKSSDPQEGGEFHRGDMLRAAEPGGARPLGSEHKIEGATDLKSSDPEEGGEFHRGDMLRTAEPGAGGGRPVGSDYFNVKIEETGSPLAPAGPGGTPIPYPNLEAAPAGGESGAGDLIARKAGGGQHEFLKVEMKEAFITRDAPTGDAHPGGVSIPGAEDHYQSSTLLDLHPEPAAGVHEMLPGLAGDLPDVPDLDLDLDADVDADTDESDL